MLRICEDCIHNKVCNEWAVTSGIPFVSANTCENFMTADVEPKSTVEELITLNSQLEATTFGQREEIKKLETALRRSLPSYYQVCSEEQAMKIGYEKGKSEAAREIFEEIESVLSYSVYPQIRADGTIKTITSNDFHIRTADYNAIKKKCTEGGDVAYGGPREGGKKFAEKRDLLYHLKHEIHEKAVRPHNAGIDAYISLKVFDAILQGYLNKLE